MDTLLAAKVWSYWIGYPLAALVILGALAFIVAYLILGVAPRYPKK